MSEWTDAAKAFITCDRFRSCAEGMRMLALLHVEDTQTQNAMMAEACALEGWSIMDWMRWHEESADNAHLMIMCVRIIHTRPGRSAASVNMLRNIYAVLRGHRPGHTIDTTDDPRGARKSYDDLLGPAEHADQEHTTLADIIRDSMSEDHTPIMDVLALADVELDVWRAGGVHALKVWIRMEES